MAITAATVRQDKKVFIADVTATLDADTGPLVVNHGLGSVPLEVNKVELLAVAHLSDWAVTAITNTSISLLKANAVGSGDGDPQIRVTVHLDPYRER